MKVNWYCIVLGLFSSFVYSQGVHLPTGFVDLKEHIPNISFDLRYYSNNNFVGDTIAGYRTNRVLISGKAAEQLKKVQVELNENGLGLLIYDAYRPQMAVDHFVAWAKRIGDTAKKSLFYPKVDKSNLFKKGYIASKSGHSRGSTVDLTIISLETGEALDMGSPFDFFGLSSWVDFEGISPQQRNNRERLQSIMNKHGFRGYAKEWWHFTLNHEPFPKTYFNFLIE